MMNKMLKEEPVNQYCRVGASLSVERIAMNDYMSKCQKYSTETIRTLDLPKAIIKNNMYIQGSEFELLPKEMTTKTLCYIYASSYSRPKGWNGGGGKGHHRGGSCHVAKGVRKQKSKLLENKSNNEEVEREEEERKENCNEEDEVNKGKEEKGEGREGGENNKHSLSRNYTINDMKQNTCTDRHMISISLDEPVTNKKTMDEEEVKEQSVLPVQPPPQIRNIPMKIKKQDKQSDNTNSNSNSNGNASKHDDHTLNKNDDETMYDTKDKDNYNNKNNPKSSGNVYESKSLYEKQDKDNKMDYDNKETMNKNNSQRDKNDKNRENMMNYNKDNNQMISNKSNNDNNKEEKGSDKRKSFTTQHIENIFYENVPKSPLKNYCIEQQQNTLILSQSPITNNNKSNNTNNNTAASNSIPTYNSSLLPKKNLNTKPLVESNEDFSKDTTNHNSKRQQPIKVSTATQMTEHNDNNTKSLKRTSSQIITSYDQRPSYTYQTHNQPHPHNCSHHHHHYHHHHCSYQSKPNQIPFNPSTIDRLTLTSTTICEKCGKSRSPEPTERILAKNTRDDIQMKLDLSKGNNTFNRYTNKPKENKVYVNTNERKDLIARNNNMYGNKKSKEHLIIFKPQNSNRNTGYNNNETNNAIRQQNNNQTTTSTNHHYNNIPYTQERVIIPQQNIINHYQTNPSRNVNKIDSQNQNTGEMYSFNNDNNRDQYTNQQPQIYNNKDNNQRNIIHQREIHKSSSSPYFHYSSKTNNPTIDSYQSQSIHSIVKNNKKNNDSSMLNFDYSHINPNPNPNPNPISKNHQTHIPLHRNNSMHQPQTQSHPQPHPQPHPQSISSYFSKPITKNPLNDYKSITNQRKTYSSINININQQPHLNAYNGSVMNNITSPYIRDNQQYRNRYSSLNDNQLTYEMDSNDDCNMGNEGQSSSCLINPKQMNTNNKNALINNDIRTKYSTNSNPNPSNSRIMTRNKFLQMQPKPIAAFNNFQVNKRNTNHNHNHNHSTMS